jgi:hypothetical protein
MRAIMTTSFHRGLSATLGVVLAGAALAGCGGSSSSELNRSQIVAKANAICAATVAAGKKVPQPSNIQDAVAAARYFDAAVPIVAKGVSQLGALKPDSSVSADYNAYTSALKASLVQLQKIQHKADAHDPSGLQDLQNFTTYSQQVNAAAVKLGAKTCGQ